MFREVTREKQRLPQEEIAEILAKEKRGILSLLGDDGYPYGVPLNHWFCPEDGHLYFHGGTAGHTIDAMRACDKASFCVYDAAPPRPGEWWSVVRSVIVFGRLKAIEDRERTMEISRRISDKFTDDQEFIEQTIAHAGPMTFCFELVPEHVTGKLVFEK